MYDESKSAPLTSPDTHNATKFHYFEVKEKMRLDSRETNQSLYKRLNLLNTGRWNGKWRDESHELIIENFAIYDAIASQLELTDRQKSIGRSKFLIADNGRYSQMGGVRAVAFCVCKLVCGKDGREYYPTRNAANNDSLFMKVADDFGLSQWELEKVIPKLRTELNNKSSHCVDGNLSKSHH